MKRLVLLALMLSAAPAFAMFDLRASYGMMNGVPKDWNDQIDKVVVNNPDVGAQTPFGIDAVFVLPIFSLEFGLRYEMFTSKESGDVTLLGIPLEVENELKGSRTSLLVGYRFLNLPIFYLGLLSHIGIASDLDYSQKYSVSGVSTKTEYTGEMDNGYGAGIEAGITLSRLLVGGEVGYTFFKAKKIKDSSGGDFGTEPMDFSGSYLKVFLGITI